MSRAASGKISCWELVHKHDIFLIDIRRMPNSEMERSGIELPHDVVKLACKSIFFTSELYGECISHVDTGKRM